MAKANAFTLDHSFYCIKCGNKGIPLARSKATKKEMFHRKKLYCCFCKEEVNHIECRSIEEVDEFKQNFKEGVYANEAETSVSFVRSFGMR